MSYGRQLNEYAQLQTRFLLRAGSRDSEADRAEDSCGAGGAGRQRVSATTSVSTAEVAFECQVPYSEVMRRLVSRYIFHFKNQHRHSGANEDDFMEIKQDISSLRYELREDRKREASRNYRNLDNLRRDIVTLFREELGGGLNVPPDGRAYSSDCGPDTIYRKPSRRGRTSLTAHSQQLSLDLGLLGRPEGGGGAAEPAPLRSPDVSVTTLASLRQLVRREVELLARQPAALTVPAPPAQQATPERTPAGSPGSAAETSPEARSLQQLSEHICQWQEAVGGAPAPAGPARRPPPPRRRALLTAQSLDPSAGAEAQRLRRQMSMDHHEPPRPG